MKSAQRNVALYYVFKLVCEPVLWGPILITYIGRVSGMKLSEIYFMEACCVIVATILQVPTGAIADKYGRANAIRIGMMFIVGEMICFTIADNRALIWISNMLWAIGFSLISGADSALIYDSLKTLGREPEFKHIAGRAYGYKLGIVAVCVIASGHLAEINIRLPIAIDTVLIIVGLAVSFLFEEPPDSHSSARRGCADHMAESVKLVFREHKLLWIITFSLVIGVTSKLWFFTYNPYFDLVKLPLHYYGYVFAVLNLIAATSSYNADAISRRLSAKTSVGVILSLIAGPILLMGIFVSKWSVPLVFLQNLVRGYIGPFLEHMMHGQIESKNRATVLSVKSACHGAVEVLAMLAFSWVTASLTLNHALTALGLVTTAVGLVLIWSYPRIFRGL